MRPFERKVYEFVEHEQLLQPDSFCLVALSGGADSVALLRVLLRLGYRVEAAHCNFHLRGKESDRDEQFARELCNELKVGFHLIHFDTKTYAEIHQVSIEMAARLLRYRYFHQLIEDLGATAICVAHHQDDAVETLLMNLLRGTGIHGLTGIRPRNGLVVRPLLAVSRAEIMDYLADCKQTYVTDSTNLVPDVLRNKIRLQLLPLMETVNPAARANLLATARHISEAEKVYDQTMQQWRERLVSGNAVRLESLKSLPSAESFLHEWLSPMGFTPAQTRQMAKALDGQPGKLFTSLTHEVLIDRDALLVEPITAQMKPMRIPEPGCYRYADNAMLNLTLQDGSLIIKERMRASVDSNKVEFPLTIRPVRPGDRFQPFGMSGSRLISDYLTDKKCSFFDKRRQLVVTDSTERILWLVGHRTAQPFSVTPETVQTLVLQITIPHSSSITEL